MSGRQPPASLGGGEGGMGNRMCQLYGSREPCGQTAGESGTHELEDAGEARKLLRVNLSAPRVPGLTAPLSTSAECPAISKHLASVS